MWIDYNKESRKQLKNVKVVAVRYNNGSTKTTRDIEHMIRYDCSSLIHQFRIVE